jgi:hypothetical protein
LQIKRYPACNYNFKIIIWQNNLSPWLTVWCAGNGVDFGALKEFL